VGNWGSEILSAMADSKKANDKKHKNVKQTLGPRPRQCVRKTISTYFVPQPVENTT